MRTRAALATILLAGLTAGAMLAGDPEPPAPQKVPHMQTLHGETLKDDYFWMREKDNPKVRAFLEAENAYTEAFMKPTEAFPEGALRRDARAHQADRPLRALPRRRLVLLLAHGEGPAVPDLLPQEGQRRGARRGLPRRQRAGQGRKVHGGRRAQRQRRRQPARLHDRQHGLPRLHAARQGPRDGKALPGDGRARVLGRLGRRQQDALLHGHRHGQAPYRLYRHTLGADPSTDVLLHEEKDEMFRVFTGRSRSRAVIFVGLGSHTANEWYWIPADEPTRSCA